MGVKTCLCVSVNVSIYHKTVAAPIARFFHVAPFIVFCGSAVRRLNQMQNYPIH